MNLYAESSAVLAWLFRESLGPGIGTILGAAQAVIASDLTLIECERILIRSVVCKQMDADDAAERRRHLYQASAAWQILRITPEIAERARQPFPAEPLRTLDAIHLSSALAARPLFAGLEMLSLDDRIRAAAQQLGFDLQPRTI